MDANLPIIGRSRLGFPAILPRLATAPLRALPDFVIIGAQKAGTSSLFAYICQHPQVLPPAGKELRLLGHKSFRDRMIYRAQFPLRRKLAAADALTFEATPTYLISQHIARRCAEPGSPPKYVAILRDPVERTLSHLAHIRRNRDDHATLDFPETDDGYVRTPDNPAGWNMRSHRHDPVARSIYDVQLQRWFECVGREAVHVLFLEELVARSGPVLDALYAFLGLPAFAGTDMIPRNKTPSRHRLDDDELRARLARRFAPANARLAALLGRDLPWPV